MSAMTIATHTLGCKLNFAETSYIIKDLLAMGFQQVDFHQKADLYVVNTCTVTAVAEKKCRNAIRQAVAQNPKAIVAVIGCFAQNEPQQVAKIEGVSIVLGNDRKHQLADIVAQRLASGQNSPQVFHGGDDGKMPFALAYSSGDRTRTFFKIQDGCDYFCTYCAIPFARGRSRSASIADTMAMARQIAQSGAKEVVLTGVNTGTFGLHQNETLLDLLRQLDQLDGIERYRISSIEPNLITDEMVRFVAQSRHFAHHFHIPLQAGSDKVLRWMHRRYTTQFYAEKLNLIHATMPEACIAADLMVGFYGETDEEFEKACRFVESLPLSYLHVFTYSERPNTMALKLDEKVPMCQRRQRSDVMHRISDAKKHQFYTQNAGTRQQVLWESDVKEGLMFGFTDNYIRVSTPYRPELVNTIQSVTLSNTCQNDIFEAI